MRSTFLMTGVLAAAVAVLPCAMVDAGVIGGPELGVGVWANGQLSYQGSHQGEANGDNTWHYVGGWGSAATPWSMTWDVLADTDPFIQAVVGFTNNTSSTQTYDLLFTMPIAPITGGTLYGGSVVATVLDASGNGFAQLTEAVPGQGAYHGLIDGAEWLTLLNNNGSPFVLTASGPPGSLNAAAEAMGLGPTLPGPASALTDIGIRLTFTLTAGDNVTFNAFFQVEPVPAPGALALLGLGAIAGGRRRRA